MVWDEIITKVQGFAGLEDDWDGEGSEAPPQPVVQAAVALAERLQTCDHPPATHVYVSSSGTIEFLWRNPLSYCEMEVVDSSTVECRVTKDGNTKESLILLI